MFFSARPLRAMLACCAVAAACEQPDQFADDASQFPLDGVACHFEATAPKGIGIEEIADAFSQDGRFCSWVSFDDRKMIGIAFARVPETRSSWEILNGAAPPTAKVCNVQDLIDSGWQLKPHNLGYGEEHIRVCGGYAVQLDFNGLTEPPSRLSGWLRELCFREADGAASIPDAKGHLVSLGGDLHRQWTLPVRFSRFDEQAGLLRLWLDDLPQTDWSDAWSVYVTKAAQRRGLALVQVNCGA